MSPLVICLDVYSLNFCPCWPQLWIAPPALLCWRSWRACFICFQSGWVRLFTLADVLTQKHNDVLRFYVLDASLHLRPGHTRSVKVAVSWGGRQAWSRTHQGEFQRFNTQNDKISIPTFFWYEYPHRKPCCHSKHKIPGVAAFCILCLVWNQRCYVRLLMRHCTLGRGRRLSFRWHGRQTGPLWESVSRHCWCNVLSISVCWGVQEFVGLPGSMENSIFFQSLQNSKTSCQNKTSNCAGFELDQRKYTEIPCSWSLHQGHSCLAGYQTSLAETSCLAVLGNRNECAEIDARPPWGVTTVRCGP